ncbi:hypothetical protein PF005_g13394 [Phytophthora fragariae]|uniref:RxLR effector protein n=2 Tax=Phytophthora TaxID=4783 RepID=A0A6A3KI98_9STRA|nr:hypothetical protein PF003_g31284 [Phytophthora fragariae]KAE9033493.1 hypothetical protein PR002_g8640 [Phytophthora rubi]KAE8938256.1 hypothetical protein PF009_g11856 [Phytophthora fragariae]KAE9003493.1 hypothetical protein PF011_g12874 [Phytophthora fragariae]KAE9039774.1 hypothetical protein PR001_g7371 [Phytophthora rubi]
MMPKFASVVLFTLLAYATVCQPSPRSCIKQAPSPSLLACVTSRKGNVKSG